MSHFKEITLESRERAELIKLDEHVAKAIAESGVKEGVCHIFVPHTTAGVTINEGADPGLLRDILGRLAQLAPQDAHYAHVEDNADSHIKAALVGSSAAVLVREGAPLLGTWQSVYFCEFDGPRRRRVFLRVAAT